MTSHCQADMKNDALGNAYTKNMLKGVSNVIQTI